MVVVQNSEQLCILDYIEGQRLKAEGMEIAATACPDWLERARAAAKYLAVKNSEVCVEDIYRVVGLPDRPNAAGSVFRGKGWHCIGWRKAFRSSRHASCIRRWTYSGASA